MRWGSRRRSRCFAARPTLRIDRAATAAAQSARRAGPIRSRSASARSAMPCRHARGDASRGAMGPIRRGRRTSPRSASPRPPTGGSDDSPPRFGCCASAVSARPDAGDTTSSRCRRPASLAQLVRLAHHRWAIEQHYQDFKTELGLDHFEGRSYPGWQHHMVISAVAYAFIQRERMRPREGPPLTFPQARAFVQEIFTGLLFISRPRYMQWMKQAEQRFRQLRI